MTQPPLDTEESETQASDASPSIKAIKALESYRKKEPLKSTICTHQISHVLIAVLAYSRRSLQSSWKCSNNETKLLQN